MNILFVCSRNQWRSPTAEAVFQNDERINVRSAGVSSSAKRRVSIKDIEWTDLIFAMEKEHKSKLVRQFRNDLGATPIHVLDIPDDYDYMDKELINLLQNSVGFHLDHLLD